MKKNILTAMLVAMSFLSGVLFTIYNQEIVGTSEGFQVTILGNVFDYE